MADLRLVEPLVNRDLDVSSRLELRRSLGAQEEKCAERRGGDPQHELERSGEVGEEARTHWVQLLFHLSTLDVGAHRYADSHEEPPTSGGVGEEGEEGKGEGGPGSPLVP